MGKNGEEKIATKILETGKKKDKEVTDLIDSKKPASKPAVGKLRTNSVYTRPVVLKLCCASESPRELVKTQDPRGC